MCKKGFTILEILVVISVIAILIGIAIPRFKGMQDAANTIKAKSEIKAIQAAEEAYKVKTGVYTQLPGDLATANLINADMKDPTTSAAYKISVNGSYYVITAAAVASPGTDLSISSTGTVTMADTLSFYCATNGGFTCIQ